MFYIINCREFWAFICLKICEILITLDKSVINLSRGTNPSFKIYIYIKKNITKAKRRDIPLFLLKTLYWFHEIAEEEKG